jgi:hypothetical protein
MKRMSLLTVLAALAMFALAGVAGAAELPRNLPHPGDPAFLVPAGKVEHTVTTLKVEGSDAIPSHERIERWMTRNRARTVFTDLTTGKVRSEVTFRPGETRIYDARRNRVTIIKDDGANPPWNSAAFEAAVQKAYVEQGITREIGRTVVDGRMAIVVQSVPGKWVSDVPESITTAVIDAATFELYERSTVHPDDLFKQTETHRVELLDASTRVRAKMAMAKHRTARRVVRRRA